MFRTERVAAENRDYQRRLAASLIGTMGVDANDLWHHARSAVFSGS